MQVDYFYEIDIDDPIEEEFSFVILFHSTFFLVGALFSVILNNFQRIDVAELRKKSFLRPWGLYTIIIFVAHLAIMGAATTYYTGPGGPTWVYPAPFFLIPFVFWIGGLSYVAQGIYTILREGVYFKSLLIALLIYVDLTGLASVLELVDILRNLSSWMLLVAMVFLYIYLIFTCLVALYKI